MAKADDNTFILSHVSFWDSSGNWVEDGEVAVIDGCISNVITDCKHQSSFISDPNPAFDVTDCKGHTLLPGLCDSHVHFLETGLQGLHADLFPARSISDVLGILKEHSKNAYMWIRGYRLVPELLKERRPPLTSELDAAFPKTPVFITRIDGHSSYMNEAAVEMLAGQGFPLQNEDLLQPMLGDRHYELFHWLNAQIDAQEKREAYRIAARQALSKGLTLVHGLIGNNRPDCIDAGILVDLLPSLPIRVVPYFQTFNIERVLDLGLNQIGGCLMIDGSLSSRTAALTQDYLDDDGNRGILYHSDSFLSDFLEQAALSGLQVAFHAIGDRAIDQLITLYDKVETFSHQRWRIEHGVMPDKKHMAMAARMGILFSVQPAFEAYAGGPGGLYSRRVGNGWRRTHPFKHLLENKILLSGGSDSPVTPLDPFSGMHYAINHPNHSQRIEPFDAVKMFTINGAYAAFLEEATGDISPGKSGDLVLLDRKIDPGKPDFISARIESVFFKGAKTSVLPNRDS